MSWHDSIDELLSEQSTETPTPQVDNGFACDAMGDRQTSASTAAGGATDAPTTNKLEPNA